MSEFSLTENNEGWTPAHTSRRAILPLPRRGGEGRGEGAGTERRVQVAGGSPLTLALSPSEGEREILACAFPRSHDFLTSLSVVGSIVLASFRLSAGPLKIELPPETRSFKPGAGAQIANAQCLVCHSVEYVTTQPPSPRTFWASSVKKMREKYAAEIPEAQVEPLLDYLVEHYGAKTNGATATAPIASANSVGASTSKSAKTPEALGFYYGCTLCHGLDKKIVGPALKDIASKYRDDPAAQAKIAEQVEKGGSGKWGPALMPPFPMVPADEVKILGDWILSRK